MFEAKIEQDNSNACICIQEKRKILFVIRIFERVRYFQSSIIIHENKIKV